MQVSELMTIPASHCGLHSNLAEAAHVMWDKDCGFVPVMDLEAGTLAGVVTDRDICMAAYTNGVTLDQLPVTLAMSKHVISVSPEDDVAAALERMREHQVRRLPVIGKFGTLAGVLALNDIIRAAGRATGPLKKWLATELLETLGSVSNHRPLVDA